MHLKTRTWALISVLCFLGAWLFWRLGDRWAARDEAERARKAAVATNMPATNAGSNALLSPGSNATKDANPAKTNAASTNLLFKYRLSNTTQNIAQLTHNDNAILLRNALIDAKAPISLGIPPHLRSHGEPGGYVVQARGLANDEFRAHLLKAGAAIVSYIPNNSYLVRMSAAGAKELEGSPFTQAVVPWEPYFKLHPMLLARAVEKVPMRPGSQLNLLAFPGEDGALREALKQLHVVVFGESRAPFGQQMMVQIHTDALVALAQLPSVQAIEPFVPRRPANDLSRARVRVATNTVVADQYLGLTGSGVMVGVNDTGVEATHGDLVGRVFGDPRFPMSTVDYNGHGTHVAGTIMGDGTLSSTVQNASGSTNAADFRGMARAASVYSQMINLISGPFVSDADLQENTARTNALISNNSWYYPGSYDYTMASASWDAAVRDALPETIGMQPQLIVFASGNEGSGKNDGTGGMSETITAPGTAKNVITVGAIENYRHITNQALVNNVLTAPFFGETDSSNQVAHFSSRGNVGIGVEGAYGRFKPDLVAPGTFVVSARAGNYTDPTGTVSGIVSFERNQVLAPGATNNNFIFVPANATALQIRILTNAQSPAPMLNLNIFASDAGTPVGTDYRGQNNVTIAVTNAANWYYAIGNPNPQTVRYDVELTLSVTNNVGTIYDVLQDLNDGVGPHYRYESGTSMSAAVVSGMLALMQEFYEQVLYRTNSPALMKALLINGARTLSGQYDFQVQNQINIQGWGLPIITNSIPRLLATGYNDTAGPILFYDQDPSTNVLVTGESHTRVITVTSNAQNYPLRFTLVWTDPPGNPAASVKLVNDLDLIVTNLDSGAVFVGNNFLADSSWTEPSTLTTVTNSNGDVTTNATYETDLVNNVENVFIQSPIRGGRFSVTVRAHRVNVNAVTGHTNGIAQDYALVISSGHPLQTAPLRLTTASTLSSDPTPNVTSLITNGVPLLHQRVGANSPLYTDSNAITNGMTNQWHFYVFHNTNSISYTNATQNNTGGQYVAFATFLPPNLSLPRYSEADIDMYVSKEYGLTNLDANVLTNWQTLKSLQRTGTESVILTNAQHGDIFYIGIKSEDQQAAEYGFFAISSNEPFDQSSSNGVVLRGFPVDIPDGRPDDPQAGYCFAFCPNQLTIQNVVVTNTLTHEWGADLLGELKIENSTNFAVLNNHRGFQGTHTWVYDDSASGLIPISQASDGPNSLRSFVGEEAQGMWMFTEVDNALFHTGRVEMLTIGIEKRDDTNLFGNGIWVTLQSNGWFYTAIDVPADATNLTVCVSTTNGPVELYLRRGAFPDQNNYDAFASFMPPGGCLSITPLDSPPLSAGRYYIGLYNPTTMSMTVRLRVRIDRDLRGEEVVKFRSGTSMTIFDDAHTNSILNIGDTREIVNVNVGVRVNHPRISDLVFHIVSPQGTRLMLMDARGGPWGTNAGSGELTPITIPQTRPGGWQADTNVIGTGTNMGTIHIDYDFYGIPDQMVIYYDGVVIFDSGVINGTNSFNVDFGPGFSTNIVIVMNPGNNNNQNTAWVYSGTIMSGRYFYLTFTENPTLTQVPIKFAPVPFATNVPTGALGPFMISDFEVPATNYYATNWTGTNVDGWIVLTNQVTVQTDTNLAHTGTNYLALANGQIFRYLPTIPGMKYKLRYAYKDPGLVAWWPGMANYKVASNHVVEIVNGYNGSLNDAISTTGMVERAIYCQQTSSSKVIIPDYTAFELTNSLSFESWINPNTVDAVRFILFRGDSAGGNDAYGMHIDSGSVAFWIQEANNGIKPTIYSPPVTAQQWIHAAGTFDNFSREMRLYLNGVLVAISNSPVNPAGPLPIMNLPAVCLGGAGFGGGFEYGGFIDEATLYSRALSFSEIQAIYNASTNGKYNLNTWIPSNIPNAQLVLDGMTNTLIGTGLWADEMLPFTGSTNTNGTSLQINGHTLGMLFDSFLLYAPDPAVYYLPEETMSPLRGQSAFGNWKLEIWDARVGAYLTNGLLSWQLEFTFANTNPPVITLTNGQCYAGRVDNSNTMFFKVVVPYDAVIATNHLVSLGGPMVLFMEQSAIPAATVPPDDYQSLPGTDIRFLLTPISTPPLYPGRTYYLAVQNAVRTETNDFDLCINFFRSTNFFPIVATLTNTESRCGEFVLNDNFITYYQFIASSNAYEVTFALSNLVGGDADLVVSHGLPLPTMATNFAISANPSTSNEVITVTDYTLTTVPGVWYIGVFNAGTTPRVDYCIGVSEKLLEIIDLTNRQAYANMVTATNMLQFYRYRVSTNAFEVDFEILEYPTGNVDLYGNYGLPLAFPTNYLVASANPGTNAELIQVWAGGVPQPYPGDWYLTVYNVSNVNSGYRIRATEIPNIDIPDDPNGKKITNTIPGYVASSFTRSLSSNFVAAAPAGTSNNPIYRQFQVGSNAVQINIELFEMDGNVDLFVRTNGPLPNPLNAHYASTNGGTTNELIVVNNAMPGTWYVTMLNRETNSVEVVYRYSIIYDTNIVALTNWVAVTNIVQPFESPAGLLDIAWYSFTVSSNAVQANLAVYNLTNNVDLYLRKGLPLPNELDYHYASTNDAANDELIIVTTNSVPVPLSAGVWYAGVLNRETNPAPYTIRFTEILQRDIQIVDYCQPWTNLLGSNSVQYHTLTVSSNAVEALFELGVNSGPGVSLYIRRELPVPTSTNFVYAATNVLVWTQLPIVYNSPTNPLTGGDWLIAIVNTNDAPTEYTLRAEQFERGINPIVLTNRVAYSNNIAIRSSICDDQFYVFTVPSNSTWTYFELRPQGDVANLGFYLRYELPLPGPAPYHYGFSQVGTNGAFMMVTTNSMPAPLTPGDWYLRVVNNNLNTNVSYEIRAVTLSPPISLIDLTNTVPYNGSIGTYTNFLVDFYRYNVSTNALQVNFEILPYPTANVDLVAGRDPVISSSRAWSYQSTNSGTNAELIAVVTNSVPEPLQAGDWYLAVQPGAGWSSNATYTIRATEYVLGSNIVYLENTVPVTRTNSGANLDYYAFVVSSNAVQVNFETLSANGNVDLFIRRDLPLPIPANANYASTNLGLTNEWIAVATNSTPVALTQGAWFVGVVNRDVTNVTYTVVATEILDTNIVVLTNCVTFTNTIAAHSNLYFVFPISNEVVQTILAQRIEALFIFPLQVNFELAVGTNLPLKLYIGHDLTLPMTNSFAYSLTNDNPSSTASVPVIHSSTNNPILDSGYWFVTLVNTNDAPVDYALQADLFSWQVNPRLLTSGQVVTNDIGPRTSGCDDQFYAINIGTNTTWAAFSIQMLTNSGLSFFVSHQLPLPKGTNYDYCAAPVGTNGNMILLLTNSVPVPLTPGTTWYLGVTNSAATNVTYTVQVLEFTNAPPPVISNGVPTNATVLAGGTDYYRFRISSNALQANFEILPYPSGNVDLFIAPAWAFLPGSNQYYYCSTNTGTNSERIVLLGNSLPYPLVPGEWIAAVVNPDTNAVNYTLRMTEFVAGTPTLVRLTNAVAFTNLPVTSNLLTSEIDYYVYNVPSNAVYVNFEVLSPSTNVDLLVRHALPLPDGSNYDYQSARPGLSDELVMVATNSLVPLAPGDWYLGVTHSSIPASNLTYTVRATFYTNVPLAITVLSNAVTYTNQLAGSNDVQYYRFTVSTNAIEAHFEILAPTGNVDLYATYGMPLPGPTNYDLRSLNLVTSNEFIRVSDCAFGPQFAGDWYLAVVNQETTNVQYIIRATEFVPATPELFLLTNGVASAATINATNDILSPGVQYYRFDVTGAVQVNYEILNPSGNVDLYGWHLDCLPTAEPWWNSTLAGYPASTNAGTTNELIQITKALLPEVWMPWHLAVVNREESNVTYTIRATAYVPGSSNLVQLTNGVPYGTERAGTEGTIDYYVFTVSSNAVRAQFEVIDPTDNVDLFLRKGLPLPILSQYDYASTNDAAGPELITLFTNSQPVALGPGEWYIGVVHRTNGPVGYTVMATEFFELGTNVIITRWDLSEDTLRLTWTNTLPGANYYVQGCTNLGTNWVAVSPTIRAVETGTNYAMAWPSECQFFRIAQGLSLMTVTNPVTQLTNGVGLTTTVSNHLQYYRFYVSSNALQVNFEILPYPSANVDLSISRATVKPNRFWCYYSSVNSGTNAESISVATNSTPYPLRPGYWYVGVQNYESNAVTYTLRVTEFSVGDGVVRLDNSISYEKANSLGVDYYVYTVSSNAVRAQFEILNPNDNFDLVARKGLPLPGLTPDCYYQSAWPANNNELISLFPSSSPVPLTPGDWFLGVVPRTGGAVNYTVVASEYATLGTNLLITSIRTSSNAVDLAWTNMLPGVSYYVQGTTNLGGTSWEVLSPTIRATSSGTNYSVPLPIRYQFYRIAEGLAPGQASTPTVQLNVSYTAPNRYELMWRTEPQQRYGVEWSRTLVPANWIPFAGEITSPTRDYSFVDDGSQTSGHNGTRFYRVVVRP